MRVMVFFLMGVGLAAAVGIAALYRTATIIDDESAGEPIPNLPGVYLNSGPAESSAMLHAKSQTTRSLIRGEIGLLEAIESFRHLDPRGLVCDRMRSAYPDATNEELYARNVIIWVQSSLTANPELGPERAEQLEDELACYLQEGSLRLSAQLH